MDLVISITINLTEGKQKKWEIYNQMEESRMTAYVRN